MIPADQEQDWDLDWFALDAGGAVAHFTTGGCGALPRSVASASQAERDALVEYFQALPEVGRAIFNPAWVGTIKLVPGANSEPGEVFRPWLRAAARGLYAFDYLDDRRRRPRPDRVVARPEVPLRADELPPEVRVIVARTVLRDVVFASQDVVGMASLL